jgi:uncharacterized protein Yka (UPF0111/DUF47 family)
MGIVEFGKKLIADAQGLGKKIVSGARQGTKFVDRVLNKVGDISETIEGVPFIGTLAKPITKLAKTGVQAGKKITKTVDRLADAGEKALEGKFKEAGMKAEEAFRKF